MTCGALPSPPLSVAPDLSWAHAGTPRRLQSTSSSGQAPALLHLRMHHVFALQLPFFAAERSPSIGLGSRLQHFPLDRDPLLPYSPPGPVSDGPTLVQ